MKQPVLTLIDGGRRPRPPECHTGIDVNIIMRIESRRDRDAVSRGIGGGQVPLLRAMDLGLVSEEGYLTPLGFEFWRRAS